MGLPAHSKGNSETGHLNIGAGKIIKQDISAITNLIESGEFYKNRDLLKAISHAKKNHSSIHLMGLLGNGGIHSHIDHLFALLDLMKKYKVQRLFLHLFSDGRDTEPKEALDFTAKLNTKLKEVKNAQISTIVGRFYAMDRDSRWDRIKITYDLLTCGKGETAKNAEDAIKKSYQRNITDEFIAPIILASGGKKNLIRNNDSVIFFNIRPDRARQLTSAFVDKKFKGFSRNKFLSNLYFFTFVPYKENLNVATLFQPDRNFITLNQILAKSHFKQLHVAETEKYAHVTYYLNGGREEKASSEDWHIVPSPKVETYDSEPEMSLGEITKFVTGELKKKKYNALVINFANPDMVGHTGNIDAAVRACEFTDKCLGVIIKIIDQTAGTAIVTADHGNIEQMINPLNGMPDTEHTKNPVPFIIYDSAKRKSQKNLLEQGILADIVPTMLDVIGVPFTGSGEGKTLVKK